jgi:preprotein translocase subunit YajC
LPNFREDFPVFISEAFAQAAPAADTSIGGLGSSMLLPLLMFVVLYFVMIRPQMKRQKEARAMIDALAKGDEVITTGGLLGKISKIGETYLTVEIANAVEVQIQRSAVAQVLPKGTVTAK